MIFLCDHCHDEARHLTGYRQLGRCESCGDRCLGMVCNYDKCEPPSSVKVTLLTPLPGESPLAFLDRIVEAVHDPEIEKAQNEHQRLKIETVKYRWLK